MSESPGDEEVKAAIEQGVSLLIAAQEGSGETPREWPYEGVYREKGKIPPGYRVGGTAIVCKALLATAGDDAKAKAGIDRGLEFIFEELEGNPRMASGFSRGYDVRGWGHIYALNVLLDIWRLEYRADDAAFRLRTKHTIDSLIKTLNATEIEKAGGWNYARGRGGGSPSTFMTATALLTLFRAKASEFDVDASVLERALGAMETGRRENGAVQYSVRGGPGRESIPGACARMAICEAVLLLSGRSDQAKLATSIQAFFDHWGELEKRRAKTGTHEGPYGIAPYYFHFGHTYVALAIELVEDREAREEWRKNMRALYWKTREEDGGWNDRVFERSKGLRHGDGSVGFDAT